ncbi:MAG: hypothetical protein ACI4JM_13290 [Oscillospiraceae bacterium]
MKNIKRFQYKIVLSTSIGDKNGIMTADIVNDKLEGNLIVMKNENYFCGNIKPNGSCEISGCIKTLIGTVSYNGEGYIDEQSATLVLNTGKRKFVVSGKALIKEES